MQRKIIHVTGTVICRIGSLETIGTGRRVVVDVICRIGSLENGENQGRWRK